MKWKGRYDLSLKDKGGYTLSLYFANQRLREFTAYWKEGHSFPQEGKEEFYKMKSQRNTLLSLLMPIEKKKEGLRVYRKSQKAYSAENPVLSR